MVWGKGGGTRKEKRQTVRAMAITERRRMLTSKFVNVLPGQTRLYVGRGVCGRVPAQVSVSTMTEFGCCVSGAVGARGYPHRITQYIGLILCLRIDMANSCI